MGFQFRLLVNKTIYKRINSAVDKMKALIIGSKNSNYEISVSCLRTFDADRTPRFWERMLECSLQTIIELLYWFSSFASLSIIWHNSGTKSTIDRTTASLQSQMRRWLSVSESTRPRGPPSVKNEWRRLDPALSVWRLHYGLTFHHTSFSSRVSCLGTSDMLR